MEVGENKKVTDPSPQTDEDRERSFSPMHLQATTHDESKRSSVRQIDDRDVRTSSCTFPEGADGADRLPTEILASTLGSWASDMARIK